MQKWRYLCLTLAVVGEKGYKVARVNGELQKNWENGPDASLTCNQFGDQGWEMVTATHETQFDSNDKGHPVLRIFMKRPY